MGFKRQLQTSLLDLIEGQPGRDALGKSQSKPPPPPPKSLPIQTRSSSTQSRLPPPPLQPSLPQGSEPTDPKNKKDKGKHPMGADRSRSSQEEDEARRAFKQQNTGHQGQRKEVALQAEPQAWLPAPMIHREPLMDNASLRDFREGEGTFVANVLERTLLLPTNMAELENLRRQEVSFNLKRYLGMAQDQTKRLLDAEDQLKIAKEQIVELKKKMAEAEGAKNVAEWARDEALRAKEVAEFTRIEAEASKEKAEKAAYDLRTWNEALKQAGVEASSDLWKVEHIYYPPAIREAAPSSSEAEVVLEEVDTTPNEAALAIATSDDPAKEVELARMTETDKGPNKKAPQDATKSSFGAQAPNVEEAPLQVDPSQVVPPTEGSKDPETLFAQLPKEGIKMRLKK
nr:uncharacterized protein LOC112009911 [Quercus suber]